ncbi:MAG TPA: hypothetical protein VKR62_04140 [Roseiarcus sp.]|nr:hypothetical protein [Roseiarcus sp.]
MKRIATVLALVALVGFAPGIAAAAQAGSPAPVKPKGAQGHKVPMRHDQLTLYPHGRPARREPAHSYSRHRFNQPTPIHNTFMGVQRW